MDISGKEEHRSVREDKFKESLSRQQTKRYRRYQYQTEVIRWGDTKDEGMLFQYRSRSSKHNQMMIKKLFVMVGMKYSAEVSFAFKMLVEKPPMMMIPTKPTLITLKAYGTVVSTVTAVRDESNNLYKEQMNTYTKKLKSLRMIV